MLSSLYTEEKRDLVNFVTMLADFTNSSHFLDEFEGKRGGEAFGLQASQKTARFPYK
ncbi:hypothetical protein [Bacillus sonorensis]|uniref:hypothetical protein n=1 Tax=Bacillus sonorensis TaxID=119858 RepID=UPI00034CAF2C|nr:hypothetical protein [Bacillus sonorensis]TWK84290.1 hypothetical protein CHCC20335_4358 [Bacillus paralicheniformis]